MADRYLTTEQAAQMLALSPKALRARMRRLQAKRGARAILQLAPGVTAVKLGVSWRIRVDDSKAA